jgi:hypothetical protein
MARSPRMPRRGTARRARSGRRRRMLPGQAAITSSVIARACARVQSQLTECGGAEDRRCRASFAHHGTRSWPGCCSPSAWSRQCTACAGSRAAFATHERSMSFTASAAQSSPWQRSPSPAVSCWRRPVSSSSGRCSSAKSCTRPDCWPPSSAPGSATRAARWMRNLASGWCWDEVARAATLDRAKL